MSTSLQGFLEVKFHPLCLPLVFPGLPDVAGLAGAGGQTRGAVHNPREWRQPLADVRPATQSALPASPHASSPGVGLRWRERGFRYARPHRAGQHPLTTGGQDSPGRATEDSLQISSCEGEKRPAVWIHPRSLCVTFTSLPSNRRPSERLFILLHLCCYWLSVIFWSSEFILLRKPPRFHCKLRFFWHWPGESLQIKAGVKL